MQKSKKHKSKKKTDDDEIIVAHEEQIESGNNFPTLPISYDNTSKGAPYFMASADPNVNHNQFDATIVSNKDDKAITYGENTIPRANIQQNSARNTRKEDENHLIYRREDEKDEDTETTGASDHAEVTTSPRG